MSVNYSQVTTKKRFATINILGIPFFNQCVDECYLQLNQNGGLLTVPSGPGLSSIPNEPVYYKSLLNSDIVIADSGYMAIIWNVLSKEKVKRISGLEFINYFTDFYPKEVHRKSVFLVNPTPLEQNANLDFFVSLGIKLSANDCYTAPFYPKNLVVDPLLLEILNKKQPHWIFLNIGGGTQEILGSWLKSNLTYKPAIICTGAAIAFKTGLQVGIPDWADKLYLGWLFRIFSSPKKYYKRYLDALPLANLLIKYRDKKVGNFS